jgi:uncharacterized protein
VIDHDGPIVSLDVTMFDMLESKDTAIAVVGATDTAGKYGGIIYRDLKARGYRVLAVNPRRATVDGDPAYPDLAALPVPADIVNFVVPPDIGRRVSVLARELGYRNLWFQPGAGDDTLTSDLQAGGATVVDGPCIMVMASRVSRTAR